MTQSGQLPGATNLIMMFEFDALRRLSAYIAENRLKEVLVAEISHMVVEANELEVFDMSQRVSIGPTLVEEPQIAGLENDGRRAANNRPKK